MIRARESMAARLRNSSVGGTLALLVVAFAGPAAADRVVVAIDPPTAETNLFWNGIGERMRSLQALVGHDPVSGAYDNSELARSWEANDEFIEWTFHLYEDAEFHFGWGPVTAHDVVHSYELHVGPDSTIVGLEHLRAREVEALDDHTVVFGFDSPRTDYAFHHAGRGSMAVYSKAQFEAEGRLRQQAGRHRGLSVRRAALGRGRPLRAGPGPLAGHRAGLRGAGAALGGRAGNQACPPARRRGARGRPAARAAGRRAGPGQEDHCLAGPGDGHRRQLQRPLYAKLVVEPIFEADLEPSAFGYRPRRSATDAIKKVHKLPCEGHTDVVNADLSQYFDTIPHRDLMRSVTRRIVDRNVLRLIKLWLKTPVEETDGEGKRRLTGGRRSTCGTPQGGVISPLLANLYMNRFLKHWRVSGRGAAYQAHVIAYADDFVILSRGHAAEALEWTRRVMAQLGLALNEAKADVKNARTERFDFLGYSFGSCRSRQDGHWYLGASPSRKSVERLKRNVSEVLRPHNKQPWPKIAHQLNSLLRDWSAYFHQGTRLMAYRAADHYVYDRVRAFLVKRHKVSSRGTRHFSYDAVYGPLGVLRLRDVHLGLRRVP